MKFNIEVNLDDIISDTGHLTGDARDDVIERITKHIHRNVTDTIDKVLTETAKTLVTKKLEELFPVILDHEFTETTSWGETKETWTVRNRLLKYIEKEFDYKKTSYSSDRNSFTKLVDETIAAHLRTFQKEWAKTVDSVFVKECFDYAKGELEKRLGLKK